MGPLAEVAPNWIHPVLGQRAEALRDLAPIGREATPWRA
jgi:2-amino-4-hydroxy-6-hydroxymethyldihydropteridine diphosphokinase